MELDRGKLWRGSCGFAEMIRFFSLTFDDLAAGRWKI